MAEPFVCPTCNAQGENADNDCDHNIVFEPCLMETDPVCVLIVTTPSNLRKMRVRYCAGREFYKMVKDRCNARGTCKVAMCDISGCKVELPA